MRRRREGGFALLLTLWVCALLSLLAAGWIAEATTAARTAHNRAAAARARAQADAGVAMAILGVLGVAADGPWAEDGRELTVTPDRSGATVRVAVQDALGLLDVNASAPETLTKLFDGLGASAADSARAAAAILRARDRAAIRDLGTLSTLDGMPPGIFARAEPYLTARTGTAAVDPATAPARVLDSLPGVEPWQARRLVEARAMAAPLPGTLPLMNDAAPGGVPDRRFAIIRADARTADGARFVRVSEIELTPAASPPFRVLSWRGG